MLPGQHCWGRVALVVVWLYIVFICCVLQAELKAFLDRKVREQHLSFAGGQYQLSKQ